MGITEISVNPLKTLAFSGVMAAFDSKMITEPKWRTGKIADIEIRRADQGAGARRA